MKNTYPKYLYHADKQALIVSSIKEEKQLGFGWADSPIKALNKKLSYFERIKRFLIKLLQGVGK